MVEINKESMKSMEQERAYQAVLKIVNGPVSKLLFFRNNNTKYSNNTATHRFRKIVISINILFAFIYFFYY